MLIYLYCILTLLLPLLILFAAIRQKNKHPFNKWTSLLLLILIHIFIYQVGAWPYIGFNWRIYFLIINFLLFGIFYWRKSKQISRQSKLKIITNAIIFTILFLLLTITNIEIYQGRNNSSEAVELQFPLQQGKYAIMQGGDSEIGNAAHRYRTPNSYALDIVELNENNRRSAKIFSKDVKDYEIYGDTIYSPSDGVVITLFDGVEENVPPNTNTVHRGGNHIVIRQGETKILICHMQKNSMQVKKGQTVKTGDVIGLVGNSGYSIEPHLHIQAYSTIRDNNMMIPMRFSGKFFSMNDIIESN